MNLAVLLHVVVKWNLRCTYIPPETCNTHTEPQFPAFIRFRMYVEMYNSQFRPILKGCTRTITVSSRIQYLYLSRLTDQNLR